MDGDHRLEPGLRRSRLLLRAARAARERNRARASTSAFAASTRTSLSAGPRRATRTTRISSSFPCPAATRWTRTAPAAADSTRGETSSATASPRRVTAGTGCGGGTRRASGSATATTRDPTAGRRSSSSIRRTIDAPRARLSRVAGCAARALRVRLGAGGGTTRAATSRSRTRGRSTSSRSTSRASASTVSRWSRSCGGATLRTTSRSSTETARPWPPTRAVLLPPRFRSGRAVAATRASTTRRRPVRPPPERAKIRGVPGAFLEDGTRLELYARGLTIVVFARSREDALRLAEALRSVKQPARGRRPSGSRAWRKRGGGRLLSGTHVARSSRRGDHACDPQARVRAGTGAGRGPGSHTGPGRGARPYRGGEHLRHRSPHRALGPVVVRARPPPADARPRALRNGRRDREPGAGRRGGRVRLGGEPRHLRNVLPLPHRPGAHVRADAHPRSRPRRRLCRLRRDPRVRRVAQRPREAPSGDRVPAGAVRERGVRDEHAGSRRPGRRRARVRARGAVHDRDRTCLRRRGGCSHRTTCLSAWSSRRRSGRRRS